MNNKYIYPCVITKDEDIYYANFIDFENCFTDGETLEEVLINAKEVLNGVVFSMIKNNITIPKPKNINVNLEKNQFLICVDIWISPLIERVKNQSIKKTLTIPKWLNDEAEKYNINYSNLLQTAIKDYLGINF